jgi:hypothetical protein
MLLTYKKKSIGHYARVLVDIDLPKWIFDEAMVERDVTLYMLRLYISEAANFFSLIALILDTRFLIVTNFCLSQLRGGWGRPRNWI